MRKKHPNKKEQNGTFPGKLNRRQQAVIADLLSGNSIRAVSSNQNIGRTTLHAWLKQPAFATALREARKTAFFEAMDACKAGSAAAVFKTLELLNDADPSIRLRAAKEILDRGFQVTEREDVNDRLDAIEKALELRTAGAQLRDMVEAAEKGKQPS